MELFEPNRYHSDSPLPEKIGESHLPGGEYNWKSTTNMMNMKNSRILGEKVEPLHIAGMIFMSRRDGFRWNYRTRKISWHCLFKVTFMNAKLDIECLKVFPNIKARHPVPNILLLTRTVPAGQSASVTGSTHLNISPLIGSCSQRSRRGQVQGSKRMAFVYTHVLFIT